MWGGHGVATSSVCVLCTLEGLFVKEKAEHAEMHATHCNTLQLLSSGRFMVRSRMGATVHVDVFILSTHEEKVENTVGVGQKLVLFHDK
mmetsp:Transcript_68349/g.110975  ORF Transcript_68349/g.110975 Transcript_68349/m.110975 type:complete len:89 (+) Transcript_68349:1-267(+)